MTTSFHLPAEIWDLPVQGINLSSGSLRSQLDKGPQLLVFLRHFG